MGKGRIAVAVTLLLVAKGPVAQTKKSPPVFEAMRLELARSMEQLKKQPTPPYFLSYEIVENDSVGATASFGALVSSNGGNRRRSLGIDLRVGSYELDNTHPIRGMGLNLPDTFSAYPMPIEDDPDALRALLWYYTDQKYKRSIEQLISVKTNVKVKGEETDRAGDFSRAKAETYSEPPAAALQVDLKAWEDKVRKYTAPFQRHGNIYDVRGSFSANRETRWFVSSDGASIQTTETAYRLSITAFSKADDGMELPRFESFYSSTLEGLPDDDTVLKTVQKMIQDLRALKVAPLMEPYIGPAILSPRATGVYFHEIFGHRIEGQRSKRENEGQTFRDKVGQKVLPEFLSVYADPTLRRLGKTELSGYYKFDNEGVKARRVPVVENGILKNFLMSRLPIDGFPESNGPGRRAPGYNVAGRQSNLLVVASKSVSRDELKTMLIEEVKKAKLPYGLYFEDIAGGFTATGRTSPNSFEVIPVMVYRIYPDGTEELVRGVDLIGTPLIEAYKVFPDGHEELVRNLNILGLSLSAFKDIVAVSDSPFVYTAPFRQRRISPLMGGLSMNLLLPPLVSVAAPSLLFDELTLQRPTGEIPNLPFTKHPFFDR